MAIQEGGLIMLWWLLGGLVAAHLLGGKKMSDAQSYTAPPGGRVTRWAKMVQEEIARQGAQVKPSQVLATIEHESGGNPNAVSYYRKPKAPYNDPPTPKGLDSKAARAFQVANWSGHAYGLGQLIPETGAQYGGIVGAGYSRGKGGTPGDSFNPAKNIKGTVAFLNHLLRKFNGDTRSVYASYYAGAGAVAKRGAEYYKDYIDASVKREAKYRGYDA